MAGNREIDEVRAFLDETLAVTNPIPLLPPVMTTTLPANIPMILIFSELCQAAVDGDLAGGHEAAVRGGEEGRDRTDLRRIGHTLERGHRGEDLLAFRAKRLDLLSTIRARAPDPVRWIVISSFGIPGWASGGEVRTTGTLFRVTDGEAQLTAGRQGFGIKTLPCFVGDADPLLVRVPGTDLHMYGTLWVLTQGETRKTKRVRLFTESMFSRLAAYEPLLAGLSTSHH